MESVKIPVARPALILTQAQVRFMRKLSRMSATNVVRAATDPMRYGDHAKVHVTKDSDPKNLPHLKRKRTQPKGSVDCVDCGKTVSANKGRCFDCMEAMNAEVV